MKKEVLIVTKGKLTNTSYLLP
uniref:Uncharacterized protein n=1 Tax=Rhizophora mucronata TaxID=61149 RepID=A0A2P2PWT3_RHIMU